MLNSLREPEQSTKYLDTGIASGRSVFGRQECRPTDFVVGIARGLGKGRKRAIFRRAPLVEQKLVLLTLLGIDRIPFPWMQQQLRSVWSPWPRLNNVFQQYIWVYSCYPFFFTLLQPHITEAFD